MKMRIIFVVVILASLAVCGLNGIKIGQRITHLRIEAQAERETRLKTEAELAATKIELGKLDQAREQAERAVESAQADRRVALEKALAQAKHSEMLELELANVRHEFEEVSNRIARVNSEPSPETMQRVVLLETTLARVQKKNQILSRQAQAMSEKLPMEPCVWYLPEDFKGRVVAVDPKWQFLVLDAGEDLGALERGELLVNREGKLIAKLVIRRVQKDHSIASVLPGWGLAEVKEGDSFVAVAN